MNARVAGIGNLKIRYAEAGSGPLVILAPGLGLTGRFYERNLRAFAASGLRLIVPDLRGGILGLDIDETVELLVEFADSLDIGAATYIGHSLGAQSVLALAARQPQRVTALVLAGPTGAPVRYRLVKQALNLARVTPREPFSLLRAVARDYITTSPLRYLSTWIKASRDQPVENARGVRCPALIVIGQRDLVPSREFIAILQQRIAGARTVRVPGGAHGVPFDASGEFNRVVTSFIRETQQ